jgi:uracil-DNA glycosylase family 4
VPIIVPGYGRKPNSVLFCGEAPGREEAAAKPPRPFVGRAGREQDAYLARYCATCSHSRSVHESRDGRSKTCTCGCNRFRPLSTRLWYLTNVCKQFTPGNPDPTPDQITRWTPSLIAEIAEVNPKLIVAVGAHAMRWFLGNEATLETCHGLVHHSGAFDSTLTNRTPDGCAVLPIYHPAAGFYDNNIRATIDWDYGRVAEAIATIKSGQQLDFRHDEFEGAEDYRDVTGTELIAILKTAKFGSIAIDTEGSADDPYSIQVCVKPGQAFVLRAEQSDFKLAIDYLQSLALDGIEFIVHSLLHDLEVCRAMGLDLSIPGIRLFDTMYSAYLLRVEPSDVKGKRRSKQGLKPLAWRWCGMRMTSYDETIGSVARDAQIDYLTDVLARAMKGVYPKPEQRVEIDNAGVVSLKRSQSVGNRVEGILRDVAADKRNKDGEPVDIEKRWKDIDRDMRRLVETDLEQPFPMPSIRMLAEKDFKAAIHYAARDADAPFRLSLRHKSELERLDHLKPVMTDGMLVAPVFEEMQSNGMPASRSAFQSLADEMQDRMWEIGANLSHTYYSDRPFNPKSPQHASALVRRRGLAMQARERTETGDISTSEKSIEHLRYVDPAIEMLFTWREHEHTKDAFCNRILETAEDEQTQTDNGNDIRDVRCDLLYTRTTTRRLASKNPNLLAITKHSKFGDMIRNCYVCPDGYTFAAYDLSQIEMRVMAHESRDKTLCKLFLDGRDVHDETASAIFGVSLDEVIANHKKYRLPAKTTNFGILYGLQALGLQGQLWKQGLTHWSLDGCGGLIRDYFRLYPGVKRYIDDVTAEVRRTGEVRDWLGMPRSLPGAWSEDRKLAEEAGRMAVSHIIQGGAQSMIQRSMIWLRPRIWKMRQTNGTDVRWRLQIHDEVIFTCPDKKKVVKSLDRLVIEGLTKHHGVKARVPIEAEAKKARRWGELK